MGAVESSRAAWCDLTQDPQWAPEERGTHRPGWTSRSWHEPRLPGEHNHDVARVVYEGGGKVRMAAVDPAVNVLVEGIEERLLAGRELVLHQLGRGREVGAELQGLARALGHAGLPRQHTTLYACAVAELDLTSGRLEVWLSGDAEVWVRQQGEEGWEEVIGEDMLTPEGRERWESRLLAARGADGGPPAIEELWRIQEEELDEPEYWVRPLLGYTQGSLHAHRVVEDVEEVILCTDGLRMSARRCAHWREWVSGDLQGGEVHPHHPSPHGDLALLHLRRR